MRHITLILAALALAVAAPAIADKGGVPNGGNGNGNGNGADSSQDRGNAPSASPSELESSPMEAKGGNGATGPLEATISLSGDYRSTPSGPMVSGDVTFTVTRSKPSDEVFWVTNTCYSDSDATVVRNTTATLWGTTDSLVGSAGPMATGGVWCVAYVTLRPWQDRPMKDAVVEYGVAS